MVEHPYCAFASRHVRAFVLDWRVGGEYCLRRVPVFVSGQHDCSDGFVGWQSGYSGNEILNVRDGCRSSRVADFVA